MCIDLIDLNKQYQKDSYLLPWIDILVEATIGYTHLSLLDAFFSYHKIFMIEHDMKKMAFIIAQGTFFFVAMLFGQKI